jgi:hypothetical protein
LAAAKLVQATLKKKNNGEQLVRLQSISYIESKGKRFAFVFYETNKGTRNLVVERDSSGTALLGKITSCDGEECQCKVRTVIGNNGEVSVDCNCKSCDMIIENTLMYESPMP